MKLRVVTFNLLGLRHRWFGERRDATVAGLKKVRPDVVCFQEATIHRNHRPFYHQAKDLAEAIGLKYVAFAPYGNPVRGITDDEGGVAVAANRPILEARSRELIPGPDPNGDARVALCLSFAATDGDFHLVNTHLSWRLEESSTRLAQMNVILEDFARCGWIKSRALLCGDLNAVEEEPVIRRLTDPLLDTFRFLHPQLKGLTWDSRNPLTSHYDLADRRIDYIFCTRGTSVLSSEVVLNQPTPVYPSDHFGLLTELEWV